MIKINCLKRAFGIDLICILICALISPAITLLFMSMYIFTQKGINDKQSVIFLILLAFFISYLNTMRIATSDTVHYLEWYTDIDRTAPLHSFLFYRGEFSLADPVFTLISILFNYITLGSTSGYLFLCTFLIYFLQFIAVYKIAEKNKISRSTCLFIILALAFCNPLFIQSVHALRQMIATSFLLCAISYRVINRKTNWLLLLASVLSHSSVILFIPIIILPSLYKEMSLTRFIKIIFVIFSFLLVAKAALPMLINYGDDSLSDFAHHAENSMNNNEMALSLGGFLLYNFPLLIIIGASFLLKGWEKKDFTPYYILYIFIFIFIVTNPISTEFSIRYGFYIWSFIPYCLLAIVVTFHKISSFIVGVFSIFSTMMFFFLLSGDPNYPDLLTLIFTPCPLF